METGFKKKKIEHWQIITFLLVIYDIVAISLSYFLALFLRFDFKFVDIPRNYLNEYLWTIPFYIVVCIIMFAIFRLYKTMWSWLYNWNNSEKWLKIKVFRRFPEKYFSGFLPLIRKNIKSWLLECSDLTQISENKMHSAYAS